MTATKKAIASNTWVAVMLLYSEGPVTWDLGDVTVGLQGSVALGTWSSMS